MAFDVFTFVQRELQSRQVPSKRAVANKGGSMKRYNSSRTSGTFNAVSAIYGGPDRLDLTHEAVVVDPTKLKVVTSFAGPGEYNPTGWSGNGGRRH